MPYYHSRPTIRQLAEALRHSRDYSFNLKTFVSYFFHIYVALL